MRVSVDRSGRLVLPAAIRRRLGLENGGDVEVVESDGVIEMRRPAADVEVVYQDGVAVLRHPDPPELTDQMIRETLESVRR